MKKIELIVNIPRKMLYIDSAPIRLENSFTDANIDHEDTTEPVLNLRYDGNFPVDYSPTEVEMDKLRETYGEDISDKMIISSQIDGSSHYLSFLDNINPRIERHSS